MYTPRLPSGQYAGWPLDRIPPAYLQWVLDNRRLDPELREAIALELGRLLVDASRPGYPATLYEPRRQM